MTPEIEIETPEAVPRTYILGLMDCLPPRHENDPEFTIDNVALDTGEFVRSLQGWSATAWWWERGISAQDVLYQLRLGECVFRALSKCGDGSSKLLRVQSKRLNARGRAEKFKNSVPMDLAELLLEQLKGTKDELRDAQRMLVEEREEAEKVSRELLEQHIAQAKEIAKLKENQRTPELEHALELVRLCRRWAEDMGVLEWPNPRADNRVATELHAALKKLDEAAYKNPWSGDLANVAAGLWSALSSVGGIWRVAKTMEETKK